MSVGNHLSNLSEGQIISKLLYKINSLFQNKCPHFCVCAHSVLCLECSFLMHLQIAILVHCIKWESFSYRWKKNQPNLDEEDRRKLLFSNNEKSIDSSLFQVWLNSGHRRLLAPIVKALNSTSSVLVHFQATCDLSSPKLMSLQKQILRATDPASLIVTKNA